MTELLVRPIKAGDREEWSRLFSEYREFCGRRPDPAIVTQVWGWLMDPTHEVRGVAVGTDNRLAGIAHFRSFSRTVDGNQGLHLDDLYIARDFRGNGTARTLLTGLSRIADAEQVEFVRWVTAEDNVNAQRLYDGVAERTSWVTYEHRPDG